MSSSNFVPFHDPDLLQVIRSCNFIQLRVLFQKVDSVLVLSRELHVTVRDLASPRDLFVNSLVVAFKISRAVERVRAAVAVVWLYIGVLENCEFITFVKIRSFIRTNLPLVMFPKDFLVELLAAAFILAYEGRRIMVSLMKPQVLHAGVFFTADFAVDVLFTMHMTDVLLQISVVKC